MVDWLTGIFSDGQTDWLWDSIPKISGIDQAMLKIWEPSNPLIFSLIENVLGAIEPKILQTNNIWQKKILKVTITSILGYFWEQNIHHNTITKSFKFNYDIYLALLLLSFTGI